MNYRALSGVLVMVLLVSVSVLVAQQGPAPAAKPGVAPQTNPDAASSTAPDAASGTQGTKAPTATKLEIAPSTKPGAASWPRFNGPRGDNKSPDTGLLKKWPAEGPKLLWKFDKCGEGFSSVAIADGMVFTAGDFGNECQVIALDMQGKKIWTRPNGKSWTDPWSGSRSTPTYSDGMVYHLNAHGQLSAYEAKTGKPVWSIKIQHGPQMSQGGFAESVMIDGNNLICMPGDADRFVVALDKKTGKDVWVSDIKTDGGGWERACYTSPLLVDYKGTKHIICMSMFRLFSLDAKTGKLEWWVLHKDNEGHCDVVAVSPIWLDGRVYMTKGYEQGSRLYAIDASGTSAKLIWKHKASDSEHAAAVAHEKCVYVSGNYVYPTGGWREKESKAGTLYCLDIDSGTENWAAKIGRNTLTYADGHIYALDEFGKVRLIEANAKKCTVVGELQLQTPRDWGLSLTHPVVFGGRLYIRIHDNLYVYDVKG